MINVMLSGVETCMSIVRIHPSTPLRVTASPLFKVDSGLLFYYQLAFIKFLFTRFS